MVTVGLSTRDKLVALSMKLDMTMIKVTQVAVDYLLETIMEDIPKTQDPQPKQPTVSKEHVNTVETTNQQKQNN
jgi:hypothetical protein